jgi:hypothetical protein
MAFGFDGLGEHGGRFTNTKITKITKITKVTKTGMIPENPS